jgi:hypothetical protein
MGLYFCIFDDHEDEVDAVEIGTYADYARFTETVTREVESGKLGSVCPMLTLHHDSDGTWSAEDCQKLLDELRVIEEVFRQKPPKPFDVDWMREVAIERGLSSKSLYECFIDIEGDFLVERLKSLCQTSIQTGHPIVFQ